MSQAPKIGLVSLGCPKALVDSERIMSTLRSQGYSFSRDYAGADIVLVNPRFEASYWGLEGALPLLGKRAAMPVASPRRLVLIA